MRPQHNPPTSGRPAGLSAVGLLQLGAQDRVITWNHLGCGQHAECAVYVECLDHAAGVIHCLTASGNARQVAFSDVVDVITTPNPITFTVPQALWSLHACDPAYLGRPVRPVAVGVASSGRVQGLVLPKFPGARPGEHLHLDCTPEQLGLSVKQLLQSLPSSGFNPKRTGDPEAGRNRAYRTAAGRVRAWLTTVGGAAVATLPLDPSLRRNGQLLVPAGLGGRHDE